MIVTHAAAGAFRIVWSLVLVSWCALAVVWSVRILSGSGSNASNAGSLALAVGSAFLALAHVDRSKPRRRGWMLLAALLIVVSWIVLWQLLDRA